VKLPGWDDLKQDIRPIVKNWFERPESSDWILVLDNADDKLVFFPELSLDITNSTDQSTESDGLAQYIPRGSKGTIIITTRDYEVADLLASTNTLCKEVLGLEEAKQLFEHHYPGVADHEEHGRSISLLLKELQYLPLAIVQVASFLRQNRLLSPSDYLKRFNSTKVSQKDLLSKQFNDIRRYANTETILATFSITFRQIQEQSPLGSSLLKMMACVDRQGIPHELLARSGLEGSDDEFFLLEAINKLINFSLITPSFGHERTYEIHSLVYVSIEAFLSPQEIKTVTEATANVLAGILPNGNVENWPVWSVYLPHASALTKGQQNKSIKTAAVSFRMSSYFLVAGRYNEAEQAAQNSVKVRAELLGCEDRDTLASRSNLARAYMNEGRWNEAEQLEVQVMETSSRVLGLEHPDTLNSIANLASTFWNQGRWKEAEQLEVQVMETSSRVLGLEHPSTLTSIANLAYTCKSQGRVDEAIELMEKTASLMSRILGEDHPNTQNSMNALRAWAGGAQDGEPT